MKVNVLIPMAGEGSRFKKNGFIQTKPIIDVGGQPMIKWVVDNLTCTNVKLHFIFVLRREHEEMFGLHSKLKCIVDDPTIVFADALTEGAACTALLAKSFINSSTPLFIVNSDQFVEWDASKFFEEMLSLKSVAGSIVCFKIPQANNDTKWSYASTSSDGFVAEIREKVVISENATVGYYYWSMGQEFVRYAEEMIEKNIRVNNEFYVAPVYNEGINEGLKFTLYFVEKMWGLGVPEDFTKFLYEYVRPKTLPLINKVLSESTALQKISLISRRGNLRGRNETEENKPSYILHALQQGFDVQCDVWFVGERWFLGNDAPAHDVTFDFLLREHLWLNCKNGEALKCLSEVKSANCFRIGSDDDCTMTSAGWMWVTTPGMALGSRSVLALADLPALPLQCDVGAVCADNVLDIRKELLKTTCKGMELNGRSKLIIFDLDGVLVESKELHYLALNEALNRVAGPEFVIGKEEHELVYDGLSTNQKLKILHDQKGLSPAHFHKIWNVKQELSVSMFRSHIKPDPGMIRTLRQLKAWGFPVACASNCIRSSVLELLDCCGALQFVDAYFSNEDVAEPKPAPDIYLLAAAAFGLTTDEVVVVEDSPKGFEAALRAGCYLIKVVSPHDVASLPSLAHSIAASEANPVFDVNIVFPLGRSHRPYWIGGPVGAPVSLPLWLMDVSGKALLQRVIESVTPAGKRVRYIFIVRKGMCEAFKLESLLPLLTDYKPTVVIKLDGETMGAVETVMLADKYLDPDLPLLICDGTIYTEWFDERRGILDLMQLPGDASIVVCHDKDPRWSYVQVLPQSLKVTAVQKGHAISNLACTGIYYWRRAVDYTTHARTLIARQPRKKENLFITSVIEEGLAWSLQVTAFFPKRKWMMRSDKDIEAFENDLACSQVPKQMQLIYDEMIFRNKSQMLESGLKADVLLSESVDERRCHAIYCMCTFDNWKPTPAFAELQQHLASLVGQHCGVLYDVWRPDAVTMPSQGCLHFTLLQLVGFEMFSSVKLPSNYHKIAQAIASNVVPEFSVVFHSVAVAPASVMILGIPSIDLNYCRQVIRAEFASLGLPMFEPYHSNLVHMTVARFVSAAPDIRRSIFEVAESFQNRFLGTLSVQAFDASPASWRMQPAELRYLPASC